MRCTTDLLSRLSSTPVDIKLLRNNMDKLEQFSIEKGIKINKIFYFDHNCKQTTLQELYQTIDQWNGVQVARLKKHEMNNFKSYFVIGKNWLELSAIYF